MAAVETIAAQQAALPDDIKKAITSAFEGLREKAWSGEEKLAKSAPVESEPKSWFADPFAMMDSVGMGYRNAPTYLTYETLRQVSEHDTYVAPIILTRIDQVNTFSRPQPNKYSVGFLIRPRFGDKKRLLTKSERERCEHLQMLVLNTGREYNVGRDGFRQFIAKFVRDSLTYDQACHPAGTMVHLANGSAMPIEDLKVGMRVWTHRGRVRRVTKVMRRSYTGEMYRVTSGGQNITCTEGHPLFAEPNTWCNLTQNQKRGLDPKWLGPEELQKGAYLTSPWLQPEVEGDVIVPEYGKLDATMASLLGLYAAEGHSQGVAATFTFCGDEENLVEFVEEVSKVVGRETKRVEYHDRNAIGVRINGGDEGGAFTSWLAESCGRGSNNKRVPPFIMTAPAEIRRAFLQGYLLGDGGINNAQTSFSTTSSDLFYGVRALLAMEKIYARECMIDYSSYGWSDQHRANISGSKWRGLAEEIDFPRTTKALREPYVADVDRAYLKISKIERWLVVDEPVFNCEVEEDHSFLANGFASHNCFESMRTRGGGIHSFNAVSSDTIRTATPKSMKGTPPQVMDLRSEIKYVQIINSSVTAQFTIDEMAFCVRNPRSHVKAYGYGLPEIETLITTITSHLWAEEWNRKIFSQGSTIKGLLNVKGNIPPVQFEAFKRMWHSQVAGTQNMHKTPMLNSEEVQWLPLQLSNTEMGYQMWMEYLCFVPGTRVMTPDGEVAIEDVEPGDFVFSHTGEQRRVINTQEHHRRGKIINIAAGGEVIRATPEHPFFVAGRLPGHRVGSKITKEFAEPSWVNAADLDPGHHYMLVPKKTYEHNGCNLDVDVIHHVTNAGSTGAFVFSAKKFAHHVKHIAATFKLDEEAAFVLGLYAAEGNATNKQVFFTFSAYEAGLAQRVVRFAETHLLTSATIYKAKETTLNVRISGRLIAELFTSLCGGGAYSKHVPEQVMLSPLVIQRAFFSGHFAGDGSVPDFACGSVVATASSVSIKLIEQLQTILLRNQVFAQRYETKQDECVRHRLDVNGTQAAKLSVWLSDPVKGDRLRARVASHHETIKSKLHEDNVYFYVPIRETWADDYDGPVHNMEVDVDNTYQVNRFATHNCKITCALFRIDPAEINFDLRGGVGSAPVFMSTNEAQQKASKDRGLQPLLNFVEDAINRHIIWKVDPRFEFAFIGLDAKTEEQAIQLRMQQVQNTHTLNEVRAMDDLSPVEDGDVVLNATYIGYKQAKQQMAMAMQQQQQASPGQPGAGQPQPGQPGAAPSPRFSQPPGAEEEHGADQLRQFTEGKPGSSSSSPDDESSGPSPRVLSQLHQDDWDSVVSHSLRRDGDDLVKAAVYDVIDLD